MPTEITVEGFRLAVSVEDFALGLLRALREPGVKGLVLTVVAGQPDVLQVERAVGGDEFEFRSDESIERELGWWSRQDQEKTIAALGRMVRRDGVSDRDELRGREEYR